MKIEAQKRLTANSTTPHRKDKRGGKVGVLVWQGKYSVAFKPNKASPRGRTQWKTISTHSSAAEASRAAEQFAAKFGYQLLETYDDFLPKK